MDLAILAPVPSPQVTGRQFNERRGSRSFSTDALDRYVFSVFPIHFDSAETNQHIRIAPSAIGIGKLEPFHASDISNGVFTDDDDPLGRVWYHIPNLGPKFCDAVRKYSIIANFREAHVVARKKSKESECMWIGIVGDPAEYTTGSKRHLIDFMLRNPGISLEQSANRRNQSRMRTNKSANPLKKRRRKRRRLPYSGIRIDSGESSSIERKHADDSVDPNRTASGGSVSHSESYDDDDSSLMSTTPSVLSMDRQASGQYGFGVRDMMSVSPPVPPTLSIPEPGVKSYTLPPPTSTAAPTDRGDWLDSMENEPHLFALREPPLPSPEPGKSFSSHRRDSPSPFMQPVRKYSVEDLNELLVRSERDVI